MRPEVLNPKPSTLPDDAESFWWMRPKVLNPKPSTLPDDAESFWWMRPGVSAVSSKHVFVPSTGAGCHETTVCISSFDASRAICTCEASIAGGCILLHRCGQGIVSPRAGRLFGSIFAVVESHV